MFLQTAVPSKIIRVLIIDDSEADFVYVRELLEGAAPDRYDIEWVNSGSLAVIRVAEQAHDIYFLDYTLGGITGLDVLRVARQSGVAAPIVMLTGRADEAIDRDAQDAGATDFLTKTELTATTLERTIRYTVENYRLLLDMERTAKQDSLTGLANRRHFSDFLAGAICRAQRSGQHLGVLLIDLDHFKEHNDRYGHDAGDRLLVDVAGLLTHAVRGGDLVARLGGDEFAIVLSDIHGIQDAVTVAKNVLAVLGRASSAGEGRSGGVTASLGVATFPEAGDNAAALIKAADIALYEAKGQGRCRYQCFEQEMQVQALRRADLHQALDLVLKDHGLQVFYQAQFCVPGGALSGLEALVRWERGGSYLSPAEFIPIAETTGLIQHLGAQVLAQACAQFQVWSRRGLVPADARIAVNVSVHQLVREGFTGQVAGILRDCGLDARQLELEITESAPIHDMRGAIRQLETLSELGVSIALDDFGTGHASLTHLQRLPVQKIKIDRSFVLHCTDRTGDQVLVGGMLAMAKALGLDVVAEGVETAEQQELLAAEGCCLMQGYLLHRPAPADVVEQTLIDLGRRNGRAESIGADLNNLLH